MELPVYSGLDNDTPIDNLRPDTSLSGFFETGTYRIQAPDEDSQLYADDAALPRDESGCYWLWQPGYFAGEVEIELVSPGQALPRRYIADVAPARNKTGRAQYAQYLRQIVDYAPVLVAGTEPAMHGLGGQSGDALSLWLRYARLRQFVGRYISGVKTITQRPIVRLRNQREQVSLPMAKRVDSITMRRLIGNPGVLASLAGTGVDDQKSGNWEESLDVPYHEPTMDNPANRLVTRQLGDIRRLVRALLRDLAAFREKSSETKTDVASRLPRRMAYLRLVDKQLSRLQRSEPFASADPSKQSAAALNAIAGNPPYNMTHRLGVRLLRQGLSDLADDEQHYLAPTWEIYEAWCFVAVARALESHFPGFTWSLDSSPASADLILKGKSADLDITLYYQMICSSLEKANKYGYCSISRERRPDLVLEVSDSESSRYVCLDSKYTASRGTILDSMASVHIYRDSVRRHGTVTDLSLILVPAITDTQLTDLLTTEDFWKRNDVGCYRLSNTVDAESLISRILGPVEIDEAE